LVNRTKFNDEISMRKDIEELQRQKTTLTTELVKAQQMLKILVDQDKNNQQMEQLKVT
jgi:hypothetical protein